MQEQPVITLLCSPNSSPHLLFWPSLQPPVPCSQQPGRRQLHVLPLAPGLEGMTGCSQPPESLERRVPLNLGAASVRDVEAHEGGGMYKAWVVAQALKPLRVMFYGTYCSGSTVGIYTVYHFLSSTHPFLHSDCPRAPASFQSQPSSLVST